MKKKSKAALASMLDNLSTIKTLDGGDNIVKTENNNQSSHKNYQPNNPLLNEQSERIIEIDPDTAINWGFHDRPESELGNLESLANEFRTVGQQQPCIVRLLKNETDNKRYEIIAGERRWRAAKLANVKLKVIIKNLSDNEAAFAQAAENSNRKDLSEYAKGMNYAQLIKEKIITRESLQNELNLSKSSIRNLLSFERVDNQVWQGIKNKGNISATTAYEITRIQTKGDMYLKALIKIAPNLGEGNIGHKKLNQLIDDEINNRVKNKPEIKTIKNNKGKVTITYKLSENGTNQISLNKNLLNKIDFNKIIELISNEVNKQMGN